MCGSKRMSGRRSSGRDDAEHYSDDDGFEEDVSSASIDDASSDFEENLSEEGLDDGDAQYDNVEDGRSRDAVDSVDDGREYDEDGWDDEDLSNRHHQQPDATRTKIVLPADVVDNALSSNATSLLTLAVFDVFFASLL